MNYLINQAIVKASNCRLSRESLRAILVCLLFSGIVIACASVPHTGRRQFNFVSDQQLNSLATQAFTEISNKEPECTDPRLNGIVKRVIDRITQAAEGIDHPGFDWKVRVIDRDTPNAACLPGGKIVVFRGIVPYAKNEAGLAAILAHEIAHAVARHGGERLSQQVAVKGALKVGGEVLKDQKDGKLDQKSRLMLSALGLGATVGVILPYSRIHEFEGDSIGQMYMAKAGYDPAESVLLWERMGTINKPPVPVWLSTHPPDDERVRKLKESLPDAQKFYTEAPTKYGLGVPL